ncbi:HAMP domain-containing histidine kinase [Ktedonobacteria bacterium brp13]|nr:HAMP domain-containing histidine kinase [Ktedonobacteria bacterium brp13]
MLNTSDSTQEQVLNEIQQHYGFIPPFFAGIVNTDGLLNSFWQETQQLYINNPFPQPFKELLFIYLSYCCHVPYDLRSHCIMLHTHNIAEHEIVTLLKRPIPTEHEISYHLHQLSTVHTPLKDWPVDSETEFALFACIAYMFVQQKQMHACRREIQRVLGTQYIFLTALLAHVDSCHHWVQADPDMYKIIDKTITEQFNQSFEQHGKLDTLLDEHLREVQQESEQLAVEEKKLEQEQTEAQALESALQEANQRLNDFLGLAAHEIKTPLTTIKGTIQILLRRATKDLEQIPQQLLNKEELLRNLDTTQRLLSRADGQIYRLTNLIDDILYITHIQEHRLNFQFEPIDLRTIVHSALEQQQKLNQRRTILVQMPSEPVLVYVDRHHIEQVIHNYLSNALKYSDRNQEVEIFVEQTGKQARLSVKDTGIGIAPEEQPHIWELFYRAKKVEIRNGSSIGFGMGLYISRSIIESHGGEAKVSSELKKGSTFWFTLPILQPKTTKTLVSIM